ncbi:hypothetical protein KC323_g133 [Hortaea werneckii]|nr:hypothetical protein KC323_g133 [Hortaea werneckii]
MGHQRLVACTKRSGLDLASNHKCETLSFRYGHISSPFDEEVILRETDWGWTKCVCRILADGLFGLTLSMFELRKSSVDRCGSSPILTVRYETSICRECKDSALQTSVLLRIVATNDLQPKPTKPIANNMNARSSA